MDGSSLLSLALLGYIAWRERAHAAERRYFAARPGGPVSPAPGWRGRRKAAPARVISAEDDETFNEVRDAAAAGDED